MFNLIKTYKNLSLHLMVLILGVTGILGKLISLETIHLVWYRMLIAFIVLAIYLMYKKRLFSINKSVYCCTRVPLLSRYNLYKLYTEHNT